MTGDAPAAIAAVWEQNRTLVRQRVAGILAAAQSIASGEPDAGLITEARRNSHNLAGMLGVFGHAEAARIASTLEQEFLGFERGEAAPDVLPKAQRLERTLEDALADSVPPTT